MLRDALIGGLEMEPAAPIASGFAPGISPIHGCIAQLPGLWNAPTFYTRFSFSLMMRWDMESRFSKRHLKSIAF